MAEPADGAVLPPAASTAGEGPMEIDLCGDGSIIKKVLTAGTGSLRPRKGADVTVHYTGTLEDGTKFDSSKDRNDPFKFKLGVGQVIKGWDEGVASMLLGEVAVFTIQSHKGYGERGSPPKIPGGATLVFEVELISWMSGEDVTEARDGGVILEVLEDGDGGYDKPRDLGTVTAHYTLECDGATVKDTAADGGAPHVFVIDDDEVPVGLELAVKAMRKGERAEVTVKPQYGYGTEGNPALGVAPGSRLKYTVQLVDFDNGRDTAIMTPEEKVAELEAKRVAGNGWFKKGDYTRAIRRYDTAMDAITGDADFSEEQREAAQAKKLLCLLNKSLCLIKTSSYRAAESAATNALAIDPASVKGLFRRATAREHLGEDEAALADARAAVAADGGNKAAAQLLAKIKQRLARARAKEKAKYAGMFDKFAKQDTAMGAKESSEKEGTSPAEEAPAGESPSEAPTATPKESEV